MNTDLKKVFANHKIFIDAHNAGIPFHYYHVKGDCCAYAFAVTFVPGYVIATGDCGELVLNVPSNRNTLAWLTGCIKSKSYILEKISPHIESKVFSKEAAIAYLEARREEDGYSEGDELEEMRETLQELRKGRFSTLQEFLIWLSEHNEDDWQEPFSELPDLTEHAPFVHLIFAALERLCELLAESEPDNYLFCQTVRSRYRAAVENRKSRVPELLEKFLKQNSQAIMAAAEKGENPYWEVWWSSPTAKESESALAEELYAEMFSQGLSSAMHKGFSIARSARNALTIGTSYSIRVMWEV